MTGEVRRRFHSEMEGMQADLFAMGELAAEAVRAAVGALTGHDDRAALAVIDGDDAIDELYMKIDQGTLEMLALQAPVAQDLRLVSVLLHSCLHLERIGDQAVNIAKIQRVSSHLPGDSATLQQIEEMGHVVVSMVRTAMEALRTRNLELCLQLPKMDDPVDRLNRNMHRQVAQLADDPKVLDWGMHMNLVARALERVGDNAVDIGEQVGFLLTGEFREYTDASHPVDVDEP